MEGLTPESRLTDLWEAYEAHLLEESRAIVKSVRVVLSGMFGLAVRYGAATSNPVRDVGTIKTESKPARALTVERAARRD